jgi:hypothetical protein
MDLLDLAHFRDLNPSLNHVMFLLDPRTIATQMVQDIPVLRDCTSALSALLSRICTVPSSLWMPPTAPARLMRSSGALVLGVADILVHYFCRKEGRVLDGEKGD